MNACQVRFEEGPALPGQYAVHAFLSESKDAVGGSAAMFECLMAFGADQAERNRCVRTEVGDTFER